MAPQPIPLSQSWVASGMSTQLEPRDICHDLLCGLWRVSAPLWLVSSTVTQGHGFPPALGRAILETSLPLRTTVGMVVAVGRWEWPKGWFRARLGSQSSHEPMGRGFILD